jgi:hypothetical protein
VGAQGVRALGKQSEAARPKKPKPYAGYARCSTSLVARRRVTSMGWIALWALVVVVGMVGLVVTVSSRRLEHSVRSAQRALMERSASRGLARPAVDPRSLPPPVARYFKLAIDADRSPVRSARLRHGGSMRLKPDAAWMPIRGEQAFSADPPGFIWWGRIRIAPGIWIDARDTFTDSEASMKILAGSILPLGDVRGPELDQGAALRVLGEMAWFPTALFDARYVTWSAIDAGRARATLRFGGREVSAVFHFGADGLPERISAQRYRDLGGGKSELTPWSGYARDYRRVAGMLIPFEMESVWELESGPFLCLRFAVEEIAYDERATSTEPARAAAILATAP